MTQRKRKRKRGTSHITRDNAEKYTEDVFSALKAGSIPPTEALRLLEEVTCSLVFMQTYWWRVENAVRVTHALLGKPQND